MAATDSADGAAGAEDTSFRPAVPASSPAAALEASADGASSASGPESRPIQIIETKSADEGYAFVLHDEVLDSVLSKVPDGMPVAVVSVVGAFRTGKSFLLSLFLRYLRNRSDGSAADANLNAWLTRDGAKLSEGNANANGKGGGADASFKWRAGHERTTTGIWMWSEPFVHTTVNGQVRCRGPAVSLSAAHPSFF